MHKNIIFSNFSFWEHQTYLNNIDLIVIGGGIVGLSSAISFKEKNKKAKVLIVEKGFLPHGASSKNAGFACFGSVSELMSDIKNNGKETVFETLEMRVKGLTLLRKRLGDKNIDYQQLGGFEIFDHKVDFEQNALNIESLNYSIKKITKTPNTYKIATTKIKKNGFKGVAGMIENTEEGQIDTGKMIYNLTLYAQKLGIIILNSVDITLVEDNGNNVTLQSSIGHITANKVIIATNGFAQKLLHLTDVKPARAQVLITKPIKNLPIKGTFHYNEGYYYFRNIGDRILFGGGRNLDFEKETTTHFASNTKITNNLVKILSEVILPNTHFEIDYTWCGIMGVGNEKKPIVKAISNNVICAVRMGGMGVAIGSIVGKLAADCIQ